MPIYALMCELCLGNETYLYDAVNGWRQGPVLPSGRFSMGVAEIYSTGQVVIVNGAFTSFNAYPEDRRNAYVSAELVF